MRGSLGPLPVKVLVAVGGTIVAAALIAAAFLFRPAAATQTPADVATPAPYAHFPLPPRGAIVFSRQLGSDALALGVVPRNGQLLLQVSVLGRQGNGVSGLAVTLHADGSARTATPCGPGCYRATFAVTGRPTGVRVDVRGGGEAARWQVALPAAWPAPDARALLARAGRVWRALHSLSFREQLASDTRHETRSTWQIQAPNRVAYQVKGGWSGIIVGARRWDRTPQGGGWVESPQTPLTQPVPGWVAVTDAHVLGTATVAGKPVWLASF